MSNPPHRAHVVAPILAADGFVYAEGVRIGQFVPERNTIAFVDRNRERCEQLGRQVVEVPLNLLGTLVAAKKE